MKKIIYSAVFVFIAIVYVSGNALAATSCESATKSAEKAKRTFIEKVELADALGNEYNTCMHNNKKGDQRICTEIKKKHKQARLERVGPRRIYYNAEARQKRACRASTQ